MSSVVLWGLALTVVALLIAAIVSLSQRGSVVSGVSRGQVSWNYFYITLGFALTLEAGVIALIKPLDWPFSLLVYVLLSGCSIYFWLFDAWFQNQLIGLQNRYERRSRSPHFRPVFGCALFVIAMIWIIVGAAQLERPPKDAFTPGGCLPAVKILSAEKLH